jgi:hypothetical protein
MFRPSSILTRGVIAIAISKYSIVRIDPGLGLGLEKILYFRKNF